MEKRIEELIINIMNTNSIKVNPTCYIYDLDEITRSVNSVTQFLPKNIKLYYAMKANPNKFILEHISKFEEISGIEVASSGELKKGHEFFDNSRVLFTGPGKTYKELESAILCGIKLINCESLVEAIRINEIAEKNGIQNVDILLRININYYIEGADEYMAGISTKMGIDQDNFFEMLEEVLKLKNLNFKGIHVFSASGILVYKNLIKYNKYVFDLVQEIENRDYTIDIIDFGGGIGIDYTKQNRRFNTEDYFEELNKLIHEYCFENKEFIFELGKYLVGSSGYYVTKIIDIKDIKGYKHIVTAGGVNHMRLPIATDRKHPVYIINMSEEKLYEKQPQVRCENVDIEGPLCMNEDKISWDEHVDKADIGDLIVLTQAGAYCYSASTLWFLSHEMPEEVIIQDNRVKVIKKC